MMAALGYIATIFGREAIAECFHDMVLRMGVQITGQEYPSVAIIQPKHDAVTIGVFRSAVREFLEAGLSGCIRFDWSEDAHMAGALFHIASILMVKAKSDSSKS